MPDRGTTLEEAESEGAGNKSSRPVAAYVVLEGKIEAYRRAV